MTRPVTPAPYTRSIMSGDLQTTDNKDGKRDAPDDWVLFPGGELEGQRPKTLCPACRARLQDAANGGGDTRRPRTLCFQCYRAGLDRDRALKAAGELDTASEVRFQSALPFEPVNAPRLEMLKADRATARLIVQSEFGRYADRRRRAQMAARHALQAIAAGLRAREAGTIERERVIAAAIHAAELQLPESWLPFVVSR